MPDPGSLIATFVAGLASFVAPCTVPLLPAYLACVSGVSAADLADAERRSSFRARLVSGSLLYVAGFATVFVVLGAGAAHIGAGFGHVGRPVEVAAGLLMVVFGLVIIGAIKGRRLARDWRFALPERLQRRGVGGAYIVGAVFGLGWTPCVGPYLAAAITLAGLSGHALTGAILLGAYALGLGLPFVLFALAWASLPTLPARVRLLSRPLTLAGGVVTIALGASVATGAYTHLTSILVQFSTAH
ncbi:MAG: cytochrome c biogenesis CcdA family protein [Candidatus Dormibacteria bacterium]